jgi:hypothetical protein
LLDSSTITNGYWENHQHQNTTITNTKCSLWISISYTSSKIRLCKIQGSKRSIYNLQDWNLITLQVKSLHKFSRLQASFIIPGRETTDWWTKSITSFPVRLFITAIAILQQLQYYSNCNITAIAIYMKEIIWHNFYTFKICP